MFFLKKYISIDLIDSKTFHITGKTNIIPKTDIHDISSGIHTALQSKYNWHNSFSSPSFTKPKILTEAKGKSELKR